VHSLADRRTTRSQRRGLALILAATIAALALIVAASAQAAPNVASAWGRNQQGQLGIGTSTGPETCGSEKDACSTKPLEVSGLSGVTAIAGGEDHSLALLESHTVMAWGNGVFGQLGDGKTEQSDVPVAVCAAGETAPCANHLSGVTAISGTENFNLALLENGTVVAWGSNFAGQLGDGSNTNSDVPVAVTGLSGVTAIAGGSNHGLALLSNGTVEAWGGNEEGQLGNGSTVSSDSPVPVSGLSSVTAISAGYNDSLALLSNGTVMAWGRNSFGALGNGGEAKSDVPVAVCAPGAKAPCASHLSGVKTISAGYEHALALLSNGTVVAWGDNGVGQLGDGSHTGPEGCGPTTAQPCAKVPVKVTGLTGVSAVSGGGEHSLALLSSGSVEAWGQNELGQLGVGTSTGPEPCGPTATPCSTTPVAVLTHGAVSGIAAGGQHSLAFGQPPPAASSLPEVGRCVKVTTKNGAYSHAGCTILAASHRGGFEWMPGPGEKKKFAGISVEGVKLETVGKQTITCGGGTFEGEYTGAKTASVTFNLIGCENGKKQSCQSAPVIEGEIQSPTPEEAELGFITGGEKTTVGLDLKPKSPSTNLWTFECGKPPETTVAGAIEGSAIGSVKRINVMSEEFTLTYKAKGGKQAPERFEGGLKDTLLITSTAGAGKGEKSEEQAGLIATVTVPNEEPLEIKAKP
jgi:alpha-tubulin suppressor-like RCC1 family protein